MKPKRWGKSLAVKAASSRLGSSALISRRIMKGLRLDYDAKPEGIREGALPQSCVSIDFDVTEPTRYDANRKGTLALLEVAERHSVPITWAVCGKAAEQDMKAYNAILNVSPIHEIAVHTYSHMDASASTRKDFQADIERCLTALGLESPRSFVFPWNREAHFDVLRDLGFRAFRGKRRALGPPILREGLWDVRPVYYVDQKSEGAERLINAYLELCVKRGGVFHLWAHPWSLVVDGETSPMMRTLDAVLGRMSELRRESKLLPTTMGGIASIMESIPTPTSREPLVLARELQ